jgi:SAM-dependent methyltransferase
MTRPDENKAATEFDQWALAGRAESMAQGHKGALFQAIAEWGFTAEHRGLDVGCGNGWVCREMVARGAGSALGVDISPKMIERARQAVSGDERFQFQVASATELPAESGSIHRCISVEALYYVPDPQEALNEWARVCAQGAQLAIVIDLFLENPATHGWIDALKVDAHLLSAEGLVEGVKKAGFAQAHWRTVQDPRPIKAESEFEASEYWPSYAMYRAYRECGSLVIEAVR